MLVFFRPDELADGVHAWITRWNRLIAKKQIEYCYFALPCLVVMLVRLGSRKLLDGDFLSSFRIPTFPYDCAASFSQERRNTISFRSSSKWIVKLQFISAELILNLVLKWATTIYRPLRRLPKDEVVGLLSTKACRSILRHITHSSILTKFAATVLLDPVRNCRLVHPIHLA